MPDIGRLKAIAAERKRKHDEYMAHIDKCDNIAKQYGLNKHQSSKIHSMAYETHHSSGYEEIEQEFDSLCQLVSDCIKLQ